MNLKYTDILMLAITASLILLLGCVSQDVSTSQEVDITPIELTQKLPHDLSFFPNFKPTTDAFDYVYKTYHSSKGKASGVYVFDGIVFVIVNIDTQKEKLRYVKGTAMLRSKAMLQKYYKLKDFKLQSRQLEDRDYRKERIYRYAVAYCESDILNLVAKQ